MNERLNDVLQQLTGELPGCLHTSVIDAATGLALVEASQAGTVNADGAAAFHADLYRMSRKVLNRLPVGNEPREMVLRGDEATVASIPVGSTGYIWLVITEPDTTVGLIQAMMRKHVSRIQQGVGTLVETG